MTPYFIIGYLVGINIAAALVCVWDKRKARKQGWRVSEKTLFIISLIGGSVGMYLTMNAIRHKTRHKKFMIGIPLIIFLQIIAAIIYIAK